MKAGESLHPKIVRLIQDNIAVKQRVLQELVEPIEKCARQFLKTLKKNKKILFCGNGGSAADSQHLAAEFVIRFRGSFNRPALPAMSLSVDTSILTAGGNDLGFDQIFARQLEALGTPGDLLVSISTSGNSANIIEAVKTAKEKKIYTIGFLGGNGGKLAALVDLPIIVPAAETTRIQETHILIGHILCQLVEEMLFKRDS